MKLFSTVILFIAFFLLLSCGQSGALYLPEPAKKPPQEEGTPST